MTDDDDFLLFDEPDETDADPDAVQMFGLVVPARVPDPSILNKLEEEYRRLGHPPVMFVDVDEETGAETFGNALEFAKLMGTDTLPTIEEADAWIDTQRWASGRWW
jgi:hypothetical protein